LELVMYNFLEPWLFSHSLGVSEVALLVAAAFWAFLWGPVGLVLSGPLTVCLVVIGKYVPPLHFLEVLLSDEQTLEPDQSFYQRLMAKDHDEAADIATAHAQQPSVGQAFDELVIPALTYVRRDRTAEELRDADEQYILRAAEEIVDDLAEHQSADQASTDAGPDGDRPKVHLLGCPARDEADRIG